MINLSSGLETGVVATGLGVMLALAVWLFFRRETHGGVKSQFLKRIDPFDDEIEPCSAVRPVLPSRIGSLPKDILPIPHNGVEALNQSMRLIPFGLPKEASIESPDAPFTESQDDRHPEKTELFQPATKLLWQQVREFFYHCAVFN